MNNKTERKFVKRDCHQLLKQGFVGLMCWLGLSLVMAKQSVQVALSANFLGTMRVIKKEFEQQTQCQVNLSSASTTVLFTQIQQGAKFDLFFSADKLHPKLLVDQRLALAKTRKTYAIGQLAFWAPGNNLSNLKKYFKQHHHQRLGLANPKFAPYGIAAQQVIKKNDSFTKNNNQLIMANNVGQAFLYVQQRAVNAGFVALSQLIDYFPKGKVNLDEIWIIPQSYYRPLQQQVVILKQGANNLCAQALLQFVSQFPAQKLIKEQGYTI